MSVGLTTDNSADSTASSGLSKGQFDLDAVNSPAETLIFLLSRCLDPLHSFGSIRVSDETRQVKKFFASKSHDFKQFLSSLEFSANSNVFHSDCTFLPTRTFCVFFVLQNVRSNYRVSFQVIPRFSNFPQIPMFFISIVHFKRVIPVRAFCIFFVLESIKSK